MKDYIFKSLRIGPEKNFTYFILCKQTGSAALFDPAFESENVFKWATDIAEKAGVELKLEYFIATHGHWDHAGGFLKLRELFPAAKIAVNINDGFRLTQLQTPVDLKLKDGDKIQIGKLEVSVLHTPGHTEGGSCFLIDDVILTGDTLFIDQCGRTDLSGGDEKTLYESLQKIKSLPENLTVYPGHDYGPVPYATIRDQKKSNPTLKAKTFNEFKEIP